VLEDQSDERVSVADPFDVHAIILAPLGYVREGCFHRASEIADRGVVGASVLQASGTIVRGVLEKF
jgi:hypothetical protein